MISVSRSFTSRALLLLLCMAAPGLNSAQESASFKLERLTITNIAERVESTGYASAVTSSTLSGISGVCPSGVASTTGFLSVLGPGEVPVVLAIAKNSGGIGPVVDLAWTGQAAGFDVYRSASPIDLEVPGNVVTTTSSCAAADTTAFQSEIFFYSVNPTSP